MNKHGQVKRIRKEELNRSHDWRWGYSLYMVPPKQADQQPPLSLWRGTIFRASWRPMASSGARRAWQDPTRNTDIILESMEKAPNEGSSRTQETKCLKKLGDFFTRAYVQKGKRSSQNNYHSPATPYLAAFLPPWQGWSKQTLLWKESCAKRLPFLLHFLYFTHDFKVLTFIINRFHPVWDPHD